MIYPEWTIEIVEKRFTLNRKDALIALDRYFLTEQGKTELKALLLNARISLQLIRSIRI